MTKRFCDRCGLEIQEVSPFANVTTSKTIFPHVILHIQRHWNYTEENFDLCHECSVELLDFVCGNAGGETHEEERYVIEASFAEATDDGGGNGGGEG